MEVSLKGKNILITGASRGIGRAIAHLCLTSGAKVSVHYGNSYEEAAALVQDFPEQARALQAGLENTEAVRALFWESLQWMGGIDVLINNAGIALNAPLTASESEWLQAWDQTLQVNLKASALLSRLTVQHCLEKQKTGRLIHIASRAAFRGDTAEYMAYAASKAGMVAFSHSIARAYGKQNIHSFVIAPGFTKTDMAQDFIEQYGEAHALNDIVLPQLTQPEDIAPTAVLLASGLADHATGSTITINAGSYIR